MNCHIDRCWKDDAGYSLSELLVTIMILGIISSAVTATVIRVHRSVGSANTTMQELAVANNASNRVGTLLRGAAGPQGQLNIDTSPFWGRHQSDVVEFYSTAGRGVSLNPMRVRLEVTADGDLRETLWMPTPATDSREEAPEYPAQPTRDRTIAANIADSNMFMYISHYEISSASQRCGREITGSELQRRADLVDSIAFRIQVRDEENTYDRSTADLRGFARFASASDVGYSESWDSADCLKDNAGFTWDEVYQ